MVDFPTIIGLPFVMHSEYQLTMNNNTYSYITKNRRTLRIYFSVFVKLLTSSSVADKILWKNLIVKCIYTSSPMGYLISSNMCAGHSDLNSLLDDPFPSILNSALVIQCLKVFLQYCSYMRKGRHSNLFQGRDKIVSFKNGRCSTRNSPKGVLRNSCILVR